MKLVIDPGHGGDNTGAIGNGIVEKDWVYKAATAISEVTKWDVLRGPDEALSLSQRGIRSRELGADLVLCLHVNANSSPLLHGTTAYYLMHQPGMKELGERIARSSPKPWRRPFHEAILAHNGPGLTDDWLQAPVNVMTPHADHALVVLIESFFLTNKQDAEFAKDPTCYAQFAHCVITSVTFFLSFSEQPGETAPTETGVLEMTEQYQAP